MHKLLMQVIAGFLEKAFIGTDKTYYWPHKAEDMPWKLEKNEEVLDISRTIRDKNCPLEALY